MYGFEIRPNDFTQTTVKTRTNKATSEEKSSPHHAINQPTRESESISSQVPPLRRLNTKQDNNKDSKKMPRRKARKPVFTTITKKQWNAKKRLLTELKGIVKDVLQFGKTDKYKQFKTKAFTEQLGKKELASLEVFLQNAKQNGIQGVLTEDGTKILLHALRNKRKLKSTISSAIQKLDYEGPSTGKKTKFNSSDIGKAFSLPSLEQIDEREYGILTVETEETGGGTVVNDSEVADMNMLMNYVREGETVNVQGPTRNEISGDEDSSDDSESEKAEGQSNDDTAAADKALHYVLRDEKIQSVLEFIHAAVFWARIDLDYNTQNAIADFLEEFFFGSTTGIIKCILVEKGNGGDTQA